MRALVVIPTYNEAGTIARVICEVLALEPRSGVIVVNDGSPDGTANLVEALQAGQLRLHLLRRSSKSGLGPAFLAGFLSGHRRGYDAGLEMDADHSYPPDRLPALLDGLATADLIIGSRSVPGGATRNRSRRREVRSRGDNAHVRLALDLPVYDATAGFRADSRQALGTLPLSEVSSSGSCFQIEMVRRALKEASRSSRCRSRSPSARRGVEDEPSGGGWGPVQGAPVGRHQSPQSPGPQRASAAGET